MTIASSSIVDANGQKLVYVQEGSAYKPLAIQTGNTVGDNVEVTKGNLAPSSLLVTQGATLLYSQALRGGTASDAIQPSSAQLAGT